MLHFVVSIARRLSKSGGCVSCLVLRFDALPIPIAFPF